MHGNLLMQDEADEKELYYIPSSILDYYSTIMEIFFEGRLFHEIALKKFFTTIPSKEADPSRVDQLYGKGGRGAWHQNYNANLLMMHPIKFSYLGDHKTRQMFCDSVVMAFWENLMVIDATKPLHNKQL
ncbi:hypothetical protein OSTOST_15084 [Ostertagia ostertagi]